MKIDREISRSVTLKPISEIAGGLKIPVRHLVPYGEHIAKIDSSFLKELDGRPDGRLIVVTSMSPTPAGEGKTTLTLGLTQALRLLGKSAAACIRQPSLGPLFGAKGGATGGGYSQALPAEEISLQFTGDDYSIVTAHNLIASIIDNHIYHGNSLGINPGRILWMRASTVSDRALRKVRIGIGKDKGERAEEFHISAASEVMSVVCLSRDIADLKERISKIILAFDDKGRPITVRDLNIQGAVTALLKNALNPNLVQSVEGAPVFIHGGPFGNISLGCSSLMATRLALKMTGYCLTEAGFSTELGAEKFFDIKCRIGGLLPSAAVVVATLKALRYHGGARDYERKDIAAALRGLENLSKHIENIKRFGVPLLVAINRFASDTDEELDEVMSRITGPNVEACAVNVWEEGGKGGLDAAGALIKLCGMKNSFNYLYAQNIPVEDKVSIIAKEMYGADGVRFSEEAKADIADIGRLGLKGLPVCVAKTPKSLSDDPALLGRPVGFDIMVERVKPAAGAGFLVAVCKGVLLMPGLPAHPLAEEIDVDDEGNITGI